jgi:hypothetical protein
MNCTSCVQTSFSGFQIQFINDILQEPESTINQRRKSLIALSAKNTKVGKSISTYPLPQKKPGFLLNLSSSTQYYRKKPGFSDPN